MEVKCERCGQVMDVPVEVVPMCGVICDECEAREEETKNRPSPQSHGHGVLMA